MRLHNHGLLVELTHDSIKQLIMIIIAITP